MLCCESRELSRSALEAVLFAMQPSRRLRLTLKISCSRASGNAFGGTDAVL